MAVCIPQEEQLMWTEIKVVSRMLCAVLEYFGWILKFRCQEMIEYRQRGFGTSKLPVSEHGQNPFSVPDWLLEDQTEKQVLTIFQPFSPFLRQN